MAVRIVTDSACDLDEELANRHQITVVPLTIRFGVEELVDRRDLSTEEFWRRCRTSAQLPETAAPSPGAFASAFASAADAGADGIACLTLSAGVSATYQAARTAADTFDRVPVEVIDTRSLTLGQGLLCLAAAEAAEAGADVAEVDRLVVDLIGRTRVYGTLATLDHLQRGGRIGGAAALLGSLLSIKPVIQVKDGVVAEESKQRTRARSLDYLIGKVEADAPLDRLAVANGAADDFDQVVARLRNVEVAHEIVVGDLGPVVGTHAGPGAIGVCYQLPAGSDGADG
jgi:DegV family protein with EDD domain